MSKYYINNLSKGMVDKINKNNLTDDYKQKAENITNQYISNSKTLIKRPPLRSAGYYDLEGPNKGIVDIQETKDRLVALRRLDMADILPLDETGRVDKSVLDEGSAKQTLDDFLGPNYHSLISAIPNYIYDNPGCPSPEIAVVETFDLDTKQRVDEECRGYMTWSPDNTDSITEFNNRADRNFSLVTEDVVETTEGFFLMNQVATPLRYFTATNGEAGGLININIDAPIPGQTAYLPGAKRENADRIFISSFTVALDYDGIDNDAVAELKKQADDFDQTAELFIGFQTPLHSKLNNKYIRLDLADGNMRNETTLERYRGWYASWRYNQTTTPSTEFQPVPVFSMPLAGDPATLAGKWGDDDVEFTPLENHDYSGNEIDEANPNMRGTDWQAVFHEQTTSNQNGSGNDVRVFFFFRHYNKTTQVERKRFDETALNTHHVAGTRLVATKNVVPWDHNTDTPSNDIRFDFDNDAGDLGSKTDALRIKDLTSTRDVTFGHDPVRELLFTDMVDADKSRTFYIGFRSNAKELDGKYIRVETINSDVSASTDDYTQWSYIRNEENDANNQKRQVLGLPAPSDPARLYATEDSGGGVFTQLSLSEAVQEFGSNAIENIHEALRAGDIEVGDNVFEFARSTAYLFAVDIDYTYEVSRDDLGVDDEGFVNRRSTQDVLHAYLNTFVGVEQGVTPNANGVYSFDDDYDETSFINTITRLGGPDTLKFELEITDGGYNLIDNATFVTDFFVGSSNNSESHPITTLAKYGEALFSRVYAAYNNYNEGGDLLQPVSIPMTRALLKADNLPQALEKRRSGAGYNVFGLKATVDGRHSYTLSGTLNTTANNLNEAGMNSFSRKEVDLSARGLDLLYTVHYPTIGQIPDFDDTDLVAQVGASYDDNGGVYEHKTQWSPLEELIKEEHEYVELYNLLKFSLMSGDATARSDLTPGIANIHCIIPDVKITLHNSDVNAAGTYLFTLNNGQHVFAATHSANTILNPHIMTTTAGSKQTAPYLKYSSDDVLDSSIVGEFTNNVGESAGSHGVTLFIQEGNAEGEDGVPVFYPIAIDVELPARVAGSYAARTTKIINIALDWSTERTREIMDQLRLVSFYTSLSDRGFSASGLSQIAAPPRATPLSDVLEHTYSYAITAVSNTAGYNGNIAQGYRANIRDYCWIYAAENLDAWDISSPEVFDFVAHPSPDTSKFNPTFSFTNSDDVDTAYKTIYPEGHHERDDISDARATVRIDRWTKLNDAAFVSQATQAQKNIERLKNLIDQVKRAEYMFGFVVPSLGIGVDVRPFVYREAAISGFSVPGGYASYAELWLTYIQKRINEYVADTSGSLKVLNKFVVALDRTVPRYLGAIDIDPNKFLNFYNTISGVGTLPTIAEVEAGTSYRAVPDSNSVGDVLWYMLQEMPDYINRLEAAYENTRLGQFIATYGYSQDSDVNAITPGASGKYSFLGQEYADPNPENYTNAADATYGPLTIINPQIYRFEASGATTYRVSIFQDVNTGTTIGTELQDYVDNAVGTNDDWKDDAASPRFLFPPVQALKDEFGQFHIVERDPDSDRFVLKVLQDLEHELENAEVLSARILNPYSTNFVVYNEHSGPVENANDRSLVAHDGQVSFSARESIYGFGKYSRGYKDYLASVQTKGGEQYLKESLGDQLDDNEEIIAAIPEDPTHFQVENNNPKQDMVVDYLANGDNGIIITQQKLFELQNIAERPVVSGVVDDGSDIAVVKDSSMFLGSAGGVIKAFKYFYEIQGYNSDVANKEFTGLGTITSGVGLLKRHNIALFTTAEDLKTLWVLAIGDNRSIKGLTRFELPVSITKLVESDDNTITLLTEEAGIMQMTFGDESVVYLDYLGDTQLRYDCIIRPVPIVELDNDKATIIDTTSVKRVAISMYGLPSLKVGVVNNEYVGGAGPVKYTSVRRSSGKNISNIEMVSAIVEVDMVGANRSRSPSIEIIESSDKYFEMSSIILDTGD